MEDPQNPELVPESHMFSDSNELLSHGHVGTNSQSVSADLWPEYCNPSYQMPSEIEVRVTVGQDQYFFPVAIVKAAPKSKLYLGGYRNKLNGHVYHHASTQTPTDQQKKMKDYSSLRSRETQTVETKTLSVQLNRECGTQMERIDLRLDNKRDHVKVPRRYVTSDELLVRKKLAVISMQRYWRGYRARCVAEEIRQRNIAYATKVREEEAIAQKIAEERRLADLARRQHPKNNSDFAVLYNELDAWRRAEVVKIKTAISDPEERKKAMAELLVNETKALQSLQQLKLSAHQELHLEKTAEMLKQMAQPLVWQLSHGETAQVHTPETQRAKQLLDLFNALHLPVTSTDQRLDILLKVKVSHSRSPCLTCSSNQSLYLFISGQSQKPMPHNPQKSKNLLIEKQIYSVEIAQ